MSNGFSAEDPRCSYGAGKSWTFPQILNTEAHFIRRHDSYGNTMLTCLLAYNERMTEKNMNSGNVLSGIIESDFERLPTPHRGAH